MTEPSSSESSPESVPAGGSMTTEPRFELLAPAPAEEEEEEEAEEEAEASLLSSSAEMVVAACSMSARMTAIDAGVSRATDS